MKSTEKQVTYSTTNSYSTLNSLTNKTKNIWIVCHGIGYLSKYFIKYFNELNVDENYIIAPQAPAKYYLNETYTHIGASWLTRENTETEIKNVLNYLDEVIQTENLPADRNIIVLGYSQGVSIASRWLARRKISCNHLVIYAGFLPNELTAQDFEHLKETKFSVIYGTNDQYFSKKRVDAELDRMKQLFDSDIKIITFDGGHVVNKESINSIV